MSRRSRRQFLRASLTLAGLALLLGCGVLPSPAPARPKVPRVGYLTGGPSSLTETFPAALRELGYREGENIVIEYRAAEGVVERLPALAAELVRLPADVIVAIATPAARAAKEATSTIHVIFAVVADPVEQGLVASLARPGGNVTGLSTLTPEISGRRVQLLKEAFPALARVVVLWHADNRGMALAFQETEAGARALGLEVQSVPVHGPDDLDGALEAVTAARAKLSSCFPASLFAT
ncbi:MAG TPA: ABC transporter substrate-binding protein [Chloroflexota bacterium]|nr:ABC transporter substrate-binding protein [Chloroflexota bacterium]